MFLFAFWIPIFMGMTHKEILRSQNKNTLPQEDERSVILEYRTYCHSRNPHKCHPRMYLSGIQTILLNSLDSHFRGNDPSTVFLRLLTVILSVSEESPRLSFRKCGIIEHFPRNLGITPFHHCR
jgi:hypothetical protein